jgi:hypothetical protein
MEQHAGVLGAGEGEGLVVVSKGWGRLLLAACMYNCCALVTWMTHGAACSLRWA